MPKKYRSDALASAHELASDLMKTGAITKQTMRMFDALCLTPDVEITPGRHPHDPASRAGQPARPGGLPGGEFGDVSQWEQGFKRPGGPSLRMRLIAFHKGLKAIALQSPKSGSSVAAQTVQLGSP